jgi:uncharacterized protein (UPF0212 family)
MSQETLKELLKPPFVVCDDGIVTGKDGWVLFKICCPSIFEDAKFSDWVVAALNEKWERDLEEPPRWVRCSWGIYECPKCKNSEDLGFVDELHNYCPHCGQKLDLPEEMRG